MARDDFADKADERFTRGVAMLREGDDEQPFVGDPLVEGMEECLDLRNYAIEAESQNRLTHEASERIQKIAREAHAILEQAEMSFG